MICAIKCFISQRCYIDMNMLEVNEINIHTHSLVPHRDSCRVVQDKNFSFKFPACFGVQQWRHHDHPFTY